MIEVHNFSTDSFDHPTDLPFGIHTIQWMKENCNCKNSIYNYNSYFLVVWITNGAGNYCINNQKGVVANNHLLFIKPGQFAGFTLTSGLEGYVIAFTPAFLNLDDPDTECSFNNMHQLFACTNGISVNPASLDDMQKIVSFMIKEFNTHHSHRSAILKQYFKVFLIYLSRQNQAPVQVLRPSRNEEILGNFMTLLELKFKTQKMVADYAAALAVTPNYLNEVIKKITGRSAGHHIRQRVTLEAKRHVLYSNVCMKSIAYDLGFLDMAHFSKFFKNNTGMNFSDFKKLDHVLQPVA